MNFWQQQQPVMALAPMEEVTDTVFREIVLGVSDPACLQVVMTEFVSTDGLCHERGRENVIHRLQVNASELELLRAKGVKLVAQIWGTDPAKFHAVAKMISDTLPFDGIDINMGCPVKKIIKKGACSGLIDTPTLAQEIIAATKEGTSLPVSVKTRIGIRQPCTEAWISSIIESRPAAITLHGRVQRQQSEGLADWNEIAKGAALSEKIPVLGNGDVLSVAEARRKTEEHHLSGIMIGRGIFANPWLFSPDATPSISEKLDLLWKHTELFCRTWGDRKSFNTLKRFYKIYVHSFPDASMLRTALMKTASPDEVRQVLDEFHA